MTNEFQKRLVHETILKKIIDLEKEQTISLFQIDFWDKEMGIPLLTMTDIPELVIQLENESNGKIKLVNSRIIKTGKRISLPSEVLFGHGEDDREEGYYEVRYSPNVDLKEKPVMDQMAFFLSKEEGLYRLPKGKLDTNYPLKKVDQRFKILELLRKEFKATALLAAEVGTTAKKYRAQIKGLKFEFEEHFPDVSSNDFIVGQQRIGYRLGDRITLKFVEQLKSN